MRVPVPDCVQNRQLVRCLHSRCSYWAHTYTYRVDQDGRRALFLVSLLQSRKERVVRPDMVSISLSKIV